MNIKKRPIISLIFLLFVCRSYATIYYCDLTIAEPDTSVGTDPGDPWSWTDATDPANIAPGDVINCRGAFVDGTFAFTSAVEEGTDLTTNIIKYQQWAAQTQWSFTGLTFAANSYYIEIEGCSIIPTASDTPANTITLTAASYLVFDQCTMEGVSRVTPATGYAPYYHRATGGLDYDVLEGDATSTFITISACDISKSSRLIDCKGGNWTITGNTVYDCGEDGININSGADNITCQSNYVHSCTPFKNRWGLQGTKTGTINTGDTVFQDRNSDSVQDAGEPTAYVWTETGGSLYVFMLTNAVGTVATTDTYVWREAVDPTNNYWTDGAGSYDAARSDNMSVESVPGGTNGNDGIVINANILEYFTGQNSAAIKIGATADFGGVEYPEVDFTNNLVYTWNAGTYALLFQACDTIDCYNNFVYAVSNPIHAVRVDQGASGTINFYNNIISGANNTASGTVNSDYNFYELASASMVAPFSTEVNGAYSQDFTNAAVGNNRYFTDYAGEDFTPFNASSPQVDTGTDASAVTTVDYVGFARPSNGTYDAGPYELDQGGGYPPQIRGVGSGLGEGIIALIMKDIKNETLNYYDADRLIRSTMLLP